MLSGDCARHPRSRVTRNPPTVCNIVARRLPVNRPSHFQPTAQCILLKPLVSMPQLTEQQRLALTAVSGLVCPPSLLPQEVRSAIDALYKKGLVWRKNGNWTLTDDGEDWVRRSGRL